MFWNNFIAECDKLRKSPTAVIEELGLSRGSVTHWKQGKVPHHTTLLKLSDYFGVSVDSLLGECKFGTRLKKAREEFGLTQKVLADSLNKDEKEINSWELGKSEPDLQTIDRLANIFVVSSDFLLGITDDPRVISAEAKKFWNQFLGLCNRQNESPNGVAKKLSIASGTVTAWKNGMMPHQKTLEKLADYFGVTTDYLLGKEEKRPLVFLSYRNDESQKMLRELEGHGIFEKEKTPDLKSNASILDMSSIYMIPTFESISAGFGVTAVDEIVDYTPLYITSASEAAETICVRVSGDSMAPKIDDGDIIQVHKQECVDDGSIAALLLDGDEALVKTVVFIEDGIELRSINPYYPAKRFIGNEANRIRILGLVKKIIKTV